MTQADTWYAVGVLGVGEAVDSLLQRDFASFVCTEIFINYLPYRSESSSIKAHDYGMNGPGLMPSVVGGGDFSSLPHDHTGLGVHSASYNCVQGLSREIIPCQTSGSLNLTFSDFIGIFRNHSPQRSKYTFLEKLYLVFFFVALQLRRVKTD